MLVHVGTSSTADDFSFGKFKKVEVEEDTKSKEEESNTEGNDTSGSDSEDLDYDPKHDDMFDDDEHIVEEVHVNMNNFSFTIDPKHDTSIGVVDVQEDDLDVIDYDSFGSDLDDGIDSERRIQLRELKRLGKKKNKGPWPSQILTTVGVDANNGIYPVAYAIVEAESKRYCVRHIHENMKSRFKGGVYKEMLWNAAKATSEGDFKKNIGELKSFNSDAYDWLMKIPLEQWSRAHFSDDSARSEPTEVANLKQLQSTLEEEEEHVND
ncbi:hypothetical protein Tco_1300100 [Tanacetum coccineum]